MAEIVIVSGLKNNVNEHLCAGGSSGASTFSWTYDSSKSYARSKYSGLSSNIYYATAFSFCYGDNEPLWNRVLAAHRAGAIKSINVDVFWSSTGSYTTNEFGIGPRVASTPSGSLRVSKIYKGGLKRSSKSQTHLRFSLPVNSIPDSGWYTFGQQNNAGSGWFAPITSITITFEVAGIGSSAKIISENKALNVAGTKMIQSQNPNDIVSTKILTNGVWR